MKRILLLVPLLLLLFASSARAAESVSLSLEASGSLFKEVYRPVSWGTRTTISVPPEVPSILPMKRATLDLGRDTIFVDSGRTKPCPDSKVGPIRGLGPVENVAGACPQSIIGGGTALFQLGQISAPAYRQVGYIIVLNGGKVDGLQQIKIVAWSYNTNAGVYIPAKLQKSGQLRFDIPRLTADSSVTELDFQIPGSARSFEGREIPVGQDPGWVRARCPGNSLDLSGSFLLGRRTSDEQSYGEEVLLTAEASAPCTGRVGKARLLAPRLSAPKSARRGSLVRVRVEARNAGTRSTEAFLAGPGVRKKIALPAEGSKKVVVKVRIREARTLRYSLSGSGQKKSSTVKIALR